MDSLATMEVPAAGYSICYELGMFKQEIKDGSQKEVADDWRIGADSWLVPHSDEMVEVRFGGQVTPGGTTPAIIMLYIPTIPPSTHFPGTCLS